MALLALPIDDLVPEILSHLDRSRSLVLRAAPGAGKTTRVPSALMDAPWARGQQIWVLEPRRLAAKMAATRVAFERGSRIRDEVGYHFRFESAFTNSTRLLFLTEGMLIRRLISNPRLAGVAAVVLDEFHERHLQGDVSLAFLRRLQLGARPDLRIVVMSATLETQGLAAFLGEPDVPCPVLTSEGRQFEVAIQYRDQPLAERDLSGGVREAVTRAMNSTPGNVLVFLPGMSEIRRAADALEDAQRAGRLLSVREGLEILPLHGDLSKEEQERAVSPEGPRRVILSTNIAETSLTLPGITAVVDGGLARVASHSPWSGLPALRTRPISRASAIQRAGRAGRTAPGQCYRLYTRGDFEMRAPFDVPEIMRADLCQTVLELKGLGETDARALPWLEAPPEGALRAAEELLTRLGAIEPAETGGVLTNIGRELLAMPAHPRIARLVIEGGRRGVFEQATWLAALLSESRAESLDLLGDFERFWKGGRHADFATRRMQERLSRDGATKSSHALDPDALAKAVLAAYPDRVARRRNAATSTLVAGPTELLLSGGGNAWLEESAFTRSSQYFVVVDAQARGQVQVRALVPIQEDWLLDGVTEVEEELWNEQRGRVEAVRRLQYGKLTLDESKGEPRNFSQAARVLAEKACAKGWRDLWEPERLQSLRERARFIQENAPEAWGESPPLWLAASTEVFQGSPASAADQSLVTALAEYAAENGFVSLRDLANSDPLGALTRALDEKATRALERLAPEYVTFPSGKKLRIRYEAGKPPWLESRMQDFFGMKEGPAVLGGKLPVTLHLLAPNFRAVQITTDLRGFWERHYPALKKELGRKYPRHYWPEDPLQAEPKVFNKPRR